MAPKKTYIYRIIIGKGEKTYVDTFMYARNSGVAIDYCKNLYKDRKYDSYKAIKVGISHSLKDTEIISEYEAKRMKAAGATRSEKYAERTDMDKQGIPSDSDNGSETVTNIPEQVTESDTVSGE